MAQYKILSTKKLNPSLIEEAKQKSIEVWEEEFIEIKPISTKEKHTAIFQWTSYPDPIAVVFTSRHAVTNTFNHLHSEDTYYVPQQWNIFCLEGATKQAVDEQGFGKQVIDTAANAALLAQKIIANGNFNKVVFFCGNKRRDELPALLKENNIDLHEIVVYETVETPVITTHDADAILFFSPSAVKSFFTVNRINKKTTCFAIGDSTAKTIANYTGNRVITSEQPTAEMMMAAVWFYFQNINCYE